MQSRLLFILVMLLIAGSCRKPQSVENNSIHKADLPNSSRTPGDILEVTKADICVPGYSKKVRDVSASLKRQVYEEYGEQKQEGICCEVDHLISLELGGSNRERNLWPERYDGEWNAHVKDQLEERLHNMVCADKLDLPTAQQAIAQNWITAYQKYISPVPLRKLPPMK